MLTHVTYRFIQRHRQIRPGDRVAVAVSGGADSVALLELLLRLRDRLGMVLSVAHFNHRLRGAESDTDAAFVEQLAARHDLPFHLGSARVAEEAARTGANLEAAGRHLRYRFLHDLVTRGDATRVATGHTADDQAETVLARLVRGAGTRGLGGIYPVLDGWLIRPVLGIRRAQLRTWLSQNGIDWREDESNRDLQYTRNRLRSEVLPLLEKLNPRLIEQLGATAEIARDEEAFWHNKIGEILSSLREPAAFSTGPAEVLKLRLPSFVQLHRAEQRRVLRAAARATGYEGALDAVHVQAMLDLALDGQSGQVLEFSALRVAKVFDWLELSLGPASPAEGFEFRLAVPGECLIPHVAPGVQSRLTLNLVGRARIESGYNVEEETLADLDSLQVPLTVRNWHPGDTFDSPAGIRKVKRLLLERRVPRPERSRWPVVLSGSQIVWVRGFPVATPFRIRPSSRAGVLIREEVLSHGESRDSADERADPAEGG